MIIRRAVRIACISIALSWMLNFALAGEHRTLQSFGVAMQHGLPVYPLPSNVALGLYDPDPLLDLAYYAEGKIQVWRNQGNGTYGSEPVYEQRVQGAVEKMEWKKSNMFNALIYDHTSWGDLLVTYADGREKKIGHEQIQRARTTFASLPQVNTPPLSFREVWRSREQEQPVTALLIDDIDNDGMTELVYFFKSLRTQGDTSRLVIYEHIGNNQYIVDWDTVLRTGGGYPYAVTDVDRNGKKEIVLISSVTDGMALVECSGPGQYQMYESNIIFSSPGAIMKVKQTDVNHNGRRELCVQHSNPSAPSGQYATRIYVAEFSSRSTNGFFSFSPTESADYYGYTFDFAVGQIDGTGVEEIVPAGGSYGYYEPVPVDYLWRSPNGQWLKRSIHTGLESGTGAVMFVNTGSGMPKFFSGAPGPFRHGSAFLLDYVADTTWRVVFADSSLRNAPLWVNSGILDGQFVVAGANTFDGTPLDTTWSDLHVYLPFGQKVGTWRLDSVYLNNFYFLDIDHDQRTDLIFTWTSALQPVLFKNCIRNFESDFLMTVGEGNTWKPFFFRLEQNYPNPFNPVTTIAYAVARRGHVRLDVYDLLGQHIATLVNEEMAAGEHKARWSGAGFPSGVYLYTLRTTTTQLTRKMVLIK